MKPFFWSNKYFPNFQTSIQWVKLRRLVLAGNIFSIYDFRSKRWKFDVSMASDRYTHTNVTFLEVFLLRSVKGLYKRLKLDRCDNMCSEEKSRNSYLVPVSYNLKWWISSRANRISLSDRESNPRRLVGDNSTLEVLLIVGGNDGEPHRGSLSQGKSETWPHMGTWNANNGKESLHFFSNQTPTFE